VTHGVCPYCAVGCAQLNFAKQGQLVAVEGDPRSPVNEGRLCPKGANTLQLSSNPHRVTRVLWRAPRSRTWEEKPADWALDRIARLVKDARDRGFVERGPGGIPVNVTPNLALIGGSAQDNEEVYLAKKLFTGGLGVVGTENQARL
jgi:formate dehydrogenase major subunit